MKQSSLLEFCIFSFDQEILHILWNLKVH